MTKSKDMVILRSFFLIDIKCELSLRGGIISLICLYSSHKLMYFFPHKINLKKKRFVVVLLIRHSLLCRSVSSDDG